MGMGRRQRERQVEFWVAADSLPRTSRHVFYDTLNRLQLPADPVRVKVRPAFDQFPDSAQSQLDVLIGVLA